MNIGIDHGYHAIKTRNCSFPAGVTAYSHEPYTLQNTLQYGGKFYVCGTGRQPILQRILRIKHTIQRGLSFLSKIMFPSAFCRGSKPLENDNYYLLTLAAIAREIQHRNAKTECSVTIAAGLPLTSFGRDKKAFREYLFRSGQAVRFRYEGTFYRITIENVKLFPQGYSALAVHPELLRDEPSVLLMDIGGWTVDLMRLDNGVPNAATCRSLEMGMIRCMEEAREQVLREKGVSVTDAQIERVLSGKNCSLESSIQCLIRKQGEIYTRNLLSAVMEAGFDLKALPVVMMGGGATVVHRSVSQQDGLCQVIPLLDDKINAEGFERIVEQMSRDVSRG